jgi:hypothetical protein
VHKFEFVVPEVLSRHVNAQHVVVYTDWENDCSVEAVGELIIDPQSKSLYRLHDGGLIQWSEASALPSPFKTKYLSGKVSSANLALNGDGQSFLAVRRVATSDNEEDVRFTTIFTSDGKDTLVLDAKSFQWMSKLFKLHSHLGPRQFFIDLIKPPKDVEIAPNESIKLGRGRDGFIVSRENGMLVVSRSENGERPLTRSAHTLPEDPRVFFSGKYLIVSSERGHVLQLS